MNRTAATTVAAAGSATATPSPASAETADLNPELAPLRDLIDAHDTAFANHDVDGILAVFAPKAALMGTGPGEIWSGPDEIKAAHEYLFDTFDVGEQHYEYEFEVGAIGPDMAWLMTSGNVNGKKDGTDFTFPLNLSITATKENGKWLIAGMHFSIPDSDEDED